jgi:hypothetical protein
VKKVRTTIGLAVSLALVLAVPTTAAAAGNIAGKATDAATGGPIPFLQVCAYDSATHLFGGCDYTNEEGSYRIETLPAGAYKVSFGGESFFGGGYLSQWYSGKLSFETADPVSVTDGNTTSGVDAAMQERGGKIAGTVTDAASGAPITGIEVCAGLTTQSFFWSSCGTTDAAGQYTLTQVEPGSYRVEFRSPYQYNEALERNELEGPNYVTQFYSGQGRADSATPVAVTTGATTAGVNAALQPGATISGTVTDAATGATLRGISVCAWGSSDYRCAVTDTGGGYSIPTLPAGSYKVEFTPEYLFNKAVYNEGKRVYSRSDFPLMDYARRYWNEKVSFEAAEPVTATAGATTSSINAKLSKEVQPPAPPPAVGPAVIAAKAKVKRGKALLNVTCQGTAPCKGILKLTARAATKKKGKAKARNVVIGKAPFGILPGKTATVKVKLSATGKDLVKKAGKKGVKVKVTGTALKPGSVTLTQG